MWNHKHNIHKKNDQHMTILTQENDQHVTILTQENDQHVTNIKKTDNRICEYCNKEYSAYTHLKRHQKKCKNKINHYNELEDLKKQLVELKAQMLEIMNNTYKMHPKTFNKINNEMTNSNNQTTNNIVINNNIKYVEYGNEDLYKVFTQQEAIKLLNYGYNSLEEIIKYTHLNDKFPQFQNIIITNKRNNEAYAYNEKLKKFILCEKDTLLEELIEFRMDDLIGFHKQYKNKLDTHLSTLLEKFFLLQRDDEFLKEKSSEFGIIIYNQCDKTKITNDYKSSLLPSDTIIHD
jgi:hypothetical protein